MKTISEHETTSQSGMAQRPRLSLLTVTQWKMNDGGVIHLNPEWSLRELRSACVILSHEMRVFLVIIVPLIAPLASLTTGSQAPGFLSLGQRLTGD